MRVPSGAPTAPAEWPAANLPRASRIPRTHTHTRAHTYTAIHAHRMRRCQVGSRSIHSQQSTRLPAMFMFLALPLPPPAPALPAPALPVPLPRLLHAAVFQCASNLGAVPRKLLQQTCRRCRRAADKLRQCGVYAMRLNAAQIKYTPHTTTATCNRMHNKQIASHHYKKKKKAQLEKY